MTVWVFGDSFAEQYPGLGDQWMQRVATILDTNIKSFGLVGSSVEFTYYNFNNVRNNIKQNDIIIIALTTHSRRWFFKDYPDHTAHPKLDTNYIEPKSIYNPTGYAEIDEALELYEDCLNNHAASEARLYNFLYNLDYFTKKLNLHTIVLVNFYDTDYFLKDKRNLFPHIHFSEDMFFNVSIKELSKEFVLSLDFTNGYRDKKVNHIIKSNHLILADKIVDNIKNKTIIDLSKGFVENIIDSNKLNESDFIRDELFNNILGN